MAQRTHVFDEFFQAAMIVDRVAKGGGLGRRERDGHGLGPDFAGPAPGSRMVFGDAAFGEPIQREDFLFAAFETGTECGHLARR